MKNTLSINKTVEVDLTPEEVASLFCNMDNVEQAIFFNEVGRISDEWEFPLDFQLEAVNSSVTLTDKGREVMKQIGHYSF